MKKKYYGNIKSALLKKFITEINDISNESIFVLISLNNLDFGFEPEKRVIMEKTLKTIDIDKSNLNSIKELINICINN